VGEAGRAKFAIPSRLLAGLATIARKFLTLGSLLFSNKIFRMRGEIHELKKKN